MGVEVGVQAARSRALAVLRVRSRALAVALLPAALAVILLAGGSTGHLVGRGWDLARWVVGAVAVVVLLLAAGIGLVVARARPAMTPTVPIAEKSAPDLYRLVRELADRLGVPAPSAIELTPDCDSWLEDRTHPAHGPPAGQDHPHGEPDAPRGLSPARPGRTGQAPVLVIGSPFLWWMRVGELRAVLAPVVAGTGPSAHPDIAAARRFVRGLDAAVAVASAPGRPPLVRSVYAGLGWVARLMLHGCREHAALMERGVAAAAAERAQAVDYGLRIAAQEQVGLAYAGWDRLLTRVALPAWRMGRWPSRLDAGVVAALTELSRRDRLAEGFTSRLGERPACDLLEEPGAVDEAASLLAARLFHGGPAERGRNWCPVDWQEYPDEVVDRKWRTDAARLHRVLDRLGVRRSPGSAADPHGPTLARVLEHLSAQSPAAPSATSGKLRERTVLPADEPADDTRPAHDDEAHIAHHPSDEPDEQGGHGGHHGHRERPKRQKPAERDEHPEHDEHPERLERLEHPGHGEHLDHGEPPGVHTQPGEPAAPEDPLTPDENPGLGSERGAALAAGISAELAREEASEPPAGTAPTGAGQVAGTPPRSEDSLPLFPLEPHRTGRELLADHVTAMVCCAAMDTADASPGLDWLDGPALLINGERAADLSPKVLALVEDGDPVPLRNWLVDSGIRPEKPVRLV
nr:hypothetical protein [Streptomyces sp. CB01373]